MPLLLGLQPLMTHRLVSHAILRAPVYHLVPVRVYHLGSTIHRVILQTVRHFDTPHTSPQQQERQLTLNRFARPCRGCLSCAKLGVLNAHTLQAATWCVRALLSFPRCNDHQPANNDVAPDFLPCHRAAQQRPPETIAGLNQTPPQQWLTQGGVVHHDNLSYAYSRVCHAS